MHMQFMRLFLLCCCCLVSLNPRVLAQQLLRSLPVSAARQFSTDEMGNIYLITKDNGLIRYNANGDSTGNFRSIQYGELEWIDVTNPLRILLYYPSFSRIVLLDRMLTVKNELDLKKLNIYNPPAVGMSADGRIWIYDYVNARLKKIDVQLNVTHTSNDMRQESQTVPRPTALLERDNRVYLCDPENGLYTFDRFAGYLNTLELKGIQKMQAFGRQLVFRKNDSLQSYDLQSLSLKSLHLPDAPDFLEARIERQRLYYLYADRLEIYRIENEE